MRALILSLFVGGALWALPPLTDRLLVYLNKPGLRLEAPPVERVEALREAVGANGLRIAKSPEGIPRIELRSAPPRRVVKKIGSQVDLSPFFEHKECLGSWDRFHACGLAPDSKDMKLVRRIDEAFVRKVIGTDRCECSSHPQDADLCPEGPSSLVDSVDPEFRRWDLWWFAPQILRLEAEIGGPGEFRSLEAAKASLHKINALLKKALYGARFPESRQEERKGEDIFWTESRALKIDFDFAKALGRVLRSLVKTGYLKGLGRDEVDRIARLAAGGSLIYYLPARCAAGRKNERWIREADGRFRRIFLRCEPGWQRVDNNARLRFNSQGCPKLEILR